MHHNYWSVCSKKQEDYTKIYKKVRASYQAIIQARVVSYSQSMN